MKLYHSLIWVAAMALVSPGGIYAAEKRNNHGAPASRERSYNCRMPRPDGTSASRPGSSVNMQYDALIGNLSLSPSQRAKAEKLLVRYDSRARDCEAKHLSGRKPDMNRYQREIAKLNSSLLKDMRKLLGARQYSSFEQRFRGYSARYQRNSTSAPKPGNPNGGLGPVVPGPVPPQMTRR